MSVDGGKKVWNLSEDHKPEEINENNRILENDGYIYQNTQVIRNSENDPPHVALGPHRVFPGRLSVSRTIGDIEAKRLIYEGNPRVVIAEPDVVVFDLKKI